jgi:hypothetical protein
MKKLLFLLVIIFTMMSFTSEKSTGVTTSVDREICWKWEFDESGDGEAYLVAYWCPPPPPCWWCWEWE